MEIRIGNGDGTFSSGTLVSTGTSGIARGLAADINGDGNMDLVATSFASNEVSVMLGDGTGTLSAGTGYGGIAAPLDTVVGDFNNDGRDDVVVGHNSTGITYVFLGKADGSLSAATQYSHSDPYSEPISVGDFDGDGNLDFISTKTLFFGDGVGNFTQSSVAVLGNNAVTAGDFNFDGLDDYVSVVASGDMQIMLSNGDGTFSPSATQSGGAGPFGAEAEVADLNGDGILDIVTTARGGTDVAGYYLGSGDGTFSAYQTLLGGFNLPVGIAIGDYNGDGAADIAVANRNNNEVLFFDANATQSGTLERVYLLSQDGALAAMNVLEETRQRIASERALIGAGQSRLSTAISNLSTLVENTRAAESQIRDADIAEEAAKQVRLNILQQAGAAVLAQANQQPGIALQLLGGL